MSFFIAQYQFVRRKNRKRCLLDEKPKQKTCGFGKNFQSHTIVHKEKCLSLFAKQILDTTQRAQ